MKLKDVFYSAAIVLALIGGYQVGVSKGIALFGEHESNLRLHNRLLEEILESDNEFYAQLRISLNENTQTIYKDLDRYKDLVNEIYEEMGLIPEVAIQRSIKFRLAEIDKKLAELGIHVEG